MRSTSRVSFHPSIPSQFFKAYWISFRFLQLYQSWDMNSDTGTSCTLYKQAALELLVLVGWAALFYWLAFKPDAYTALGFEPPKPKTHEEELQPSTQTPNTSPHKSPSKFKTWLMPYYIVIMVLAYYERPLTILYSYSSSALTHWNEFEADNFSATHTGKENMLDVIYQCTSIQDSRPTPELEIHS